MTAPTSQTQSPSGQPPVRNRRAHVVAIAIVAVLALVGAGVAIGLWVGHGTEPAAVQTPTGTPTGGPTSSTPQTTPPSTPATTAPSTAPTFRYQPVFPFANGAEVLAWQESYRSGGHQPWHLDAAETARAFTTGFLGFHDVDHVMTTVVRGDDAWVTVGYHVEGRTFAAAIVHLARFGTGSDAPWEVAGTRDTRLTLTSPAYGATVTSPVTVGGRITGVDESLTVSVRQLSSQAALGRVAGVPAGGMHQPWSMPVPFSGASSDQVVTIVVSTGGHVAAVEQFAVTAVRVAP